MRLLPVSLVCAVGLACAPATPPKSTGDDAGTTDPTVPVDTAEPDPGDSGDAIPSAYTPLRVLEVEIELDPTDWERLRTESRDLVELLTGDCLSEPFGSPYTWFPGTVTIDGETFSPVDVRKKGFIGSLSTSRPSLKLDLVEFDDLDFEGVERLTLNNSVSDISRVRQCLSYSIFEDAGIPAPRCNFATVSVNGENLGLYVHLEPMKEPFLERAFGDGSGDLFEGTLSDFTAESKGTLERKTNEDSDDRSALEALVAAGQVDDDVLLEALDAELDLDWFFTFWAAEVLTIHLDGYAGNRNNFFLYEDPTDGRFRFLPWGTDGTLYPDLGDDFGSPYDSVYVTGWLARRLYAHPEGQARYLARLDELLATVWDEEVLHARADAMLEVIGPHITPAERRDFEWSVWSVHEAIDSRREVIEEARAGGPERVRGTYEPQVCFDEVGTWSADFATTYREGGLATVLDHGTVDLSVTLEDESLVFVDTGAIVAVGDGGTTVVVLEGEAPDGLRYTLYYDLGAIEVAPGSWPLDLVRRAGYLLLSDDTTGTEYEFAAYLGGDLTFSEAGGSRGDPIAGAGGGTILYW